jgi:hypothetical protein
MTTRMKMVKAAPEMTDWRKMSDSLTKLQTKLHEGLGPVRLITGLGSADQKMAPTLNPRDIVNMFLLVEEVLEDVDTDLKTLIRQCDEGKAR